MDSPLTCNQQRRKKVTNLSPLLFFLLLLLSLLVYFVFLCVHLLVGSSFSSFPLLRNTGSALSGEFLNLTKVQRTDSGAYICIAVSKVL